ncbi:MAG: hypothetical protein ACE5FG_05025 [Myxococcota bacterium]
MAFQLGMLAIGGLALLFWGPWSPELPSLELPELRASFPGESRVPPVTVVLLPDRSSVRVLREAVAPERVVVSSEEAVVLAEGHVFATSIEAATEPINRAGWAERPIRFARGSGQARPSAVRHEEATAGASQRATDADAFLSLKDERSLSHSDTLRLLEAMERRGDL